MRYNILLATILASWVFFSMNSLADNTDQDKMQGTWRPDAAELAGAKYPGDVHKSFTLIIHGDEYTVITGEATDKGKLKSDSTATPRTLDITGTDGPNKGRTILAIYEIDGDTLKICYELSGKDRPTEFKTKPKSQLFLVTYKRSAA